MYTTLAKYGRAFPVKNELTINALNGQQMAPNVTREQLSVHSKNKRLRKNKTMTSTSLTTLENIYTFEKTHAYRIHCKIFAREYQENGSFTILETSNIR